MGKRKDITTILVIGAGPIVIGQAGEFDYSGTQACKVLKEEGYKVILINSNPATIMTDSDTADVIYIEPITPEFVEKIIIKERPDAILPNVGGQTALNCVMALQKAGVLDKYRVEMIGTSCEAIFKAENRRKFAEVVENIGLSMPKNVIVSHKSEIKDALQYVGLPAIIRPSFTLGGAGGGIAFTEEEFVTKVLHGISISPTNEVQIDESIIGWKEYELEVMCDKVGNAIIVCGIENIDPMGVHTGDSITVAPIITLRDEEYQIMRNAAIKILAEVGVKTGGSNVQFALNPFNGDLKVIEMNPRVSRSSALASKATGYPIANVATKLAIGYRLDEISNGCVKSIPASFEPALDYIVTKIPRFNFEKFVTSKQELSSSMKSVGEVMGIGRSFNESIQNALCSLENGLTGFNEIIPKDKLTKDYIEQELAKFSPNRILIIADALRFGIDAKRINEITHYDMWFLRQIESIVQTENYIKTLDIASISGKQLLLIKKMGFSDRRIAELTNKDQTYIANLRHKLGVTPVYKNIDTCAAEFPSSTAYLYACYEGDGINNPSCEAFPSDKRKVIVLGSGPNRIGQGIEFDYVCVHGIKAIREKGYEAIMINCNPETVSTDYDISDKLYFVPITYENIIEIVRKEQSKGNFLGIIIQFGGQTPLRLSESLQDAGVPILGSSFDAIDICEDRDRFKQLLTKLNLKQPTSAICHNVDQVIDIVEQVKLPVIVRPSYVLGGQSMKIIYDYEYLNSYLEQRKKDRVFDRGALLVDKYIVNAIEVDVDALSDGDEVYIAGIMQHVEEAGVHSGDSACSLPPYNLRLDIVQEIKRQTIIIAKELNICGFFNIQFAVNNNDIYVLEVNPRASRTIPFVAKATGTQVAKIATKLMLGDKLDAFDLKDEVLNLSHFSIKYPVFPFSRFPDSDIILGPEMKSTGEVMGVDYDFEAATVKAYIASGHSLPAQGNVFVSVKERDKPKIIMAVTILKDIGFQLFATGGTADYLKSQGIEATRVNKVKEGSPHIVEMLIQDKIDLMINTSEGLRSIADSFSIRSTAIIKGIPCCTNIASANILANAIKNSSVNEINVRPIGDYHL